MRMPAGTRLGHYEILAPIGAGGMGEVYRARDARLDRQVALKLLPPEVTADPERLRRFEQEARAASALSHPAILTIFEFGEAQLAGPDGNASAREPGAGAQPYIAMELVEGRTLRAILAEGPVPLRRALQIAAPLADGLAKAHETGIVHRDLKPENIIVSSDGFAKILDFGLAKLLPHDLETDGITRTVRATRPGVVLGTAAYMSPEQARGEPAGAPADQFSFGLILYELFTGRHPFNRPSAVETMAAIVREEPEPIDRVAPGVPPPVQWIVERCLAKAPADRYASTRDLARDLAGARDRLSQLTGASPAVTATAPRMTRRERLAWTAAALFAAIAIAAVLWPRDAPVRAGPVVRFAIPPPGDGAILASGVLGSPIAVSPDGRHVVFAASGGGSGRRLWLRSLDSPAPRPLAGTEGALLPFWSPDSRSVGFAAANQLRRVSIEGGDVSVVCDAPALGGAAWNADGVIIYGANLESPLYRVSANGGSPTPLTTLDMAAGDSGHMWPLFLPDGRHFVFQIVGGERTGIYLAVLDAPEPRRLMAGDIGASEMSTVGFTLPGYLLFVRNRVLLARAFDLERLSLGSETWRVAEGVENPGPAAAFSVSPNGVLAYWAGEAIRSQLTWTDRQGRALAAVGEPADYVHLSLSPDDRHAVVDRADFSGIWLVDLARGSLSRATEPNALSPVISPDGSAIAFAGVRDTPPNPFLKRLGVGADEQRLARHRTQAFPTSWTPDGRSILYTLADPQTGDDLWLVSVDGGEPRSVIRTRPNESYGRISPDGRWLAYTSDETGRAEVYVTTFPTPGPKWQVSTNGGVYMVWRSDGRELVYEAPNGMLMAVPVSGGPTFDPARPQELFRPTPPRPLARGLGPTFALSSDGRRLLVNNEIARSSPPISVIVNWLGDRGAPRP